MLLHLVLSFVAWAGATERQQRQREPLVIGDTFTIQSTELDEVRRINVYAPPAYTESSTLRLPVLYMPDGGMKEDFLHIAGLLQISVTNGTARPLLLVGIENTERRRDMTGPTTNDEDRKIAPRVGVPLTRGAVYRRRKPAAGKCRGRSVRRTRPSGKTFA